MQGVWSGVWKSASLTSSSDLIWGPHSEKHSCMSGYQHRLHTGSTKRLSKYRWTLFTPRYSDTIGVRCSLDARIFQSHFRWCSYAADGRPPGADPPLMPSDYLLGNLLSATWYRKCSWETAGVRSGFTLHSDISGFQGHCLGLWH